jgi:hypothetical protein
MPTVQSISPFTAADFNAAIAALDRDLLSHNRAIEILHRAGIPTPQHARAIRRHERCIATIHGKQRRLAERLHWAKWRDAP